MPKGRAPLEAGALAEVGQQVGNPLWKAELMGVFIKASSGCCIRRTGLTGAMTAVLRGASVETELSLASIMAPLESESVEASVESAPLEKVVVGTGASLERTEVLAIWTGGPSKSDSVEGEAPPLELTC